MIMRMSCRFVGLLLFFFLMLLSTSYARNDLMFVSVNAHLVNTRLDPLTNRGTCSGHVHSVFGSASFSDTVKKRDVTDDDWQDDTGKIDQTTSNVIPNKSMYWAPSMYILNPNDNMYYIVPTFTRAYYRIKHPNDHSVIHPFPEFLRMIVGDASRMTEWSPNDEHDAIRWTKRLENRGTTNPVEHGDWSYLRTEGVAGLKQLEMNINFPTCLELKNSGPPRTRSRNYRNHAAYANGTTCPPDFPYHIPELNLEVRYELDEMRLILGADVVDNIDNWRLSTGDATGAGAHADFISGWPEDLMQQAISFCRNSVDPTGQHYCPIERYSNQTRAEMGAKVVPFTSDVPNEIVSPVSSLPNSDSDCTLVPFDSL